MVKYTHKLMLLSAVTVLTLGNLVGVVQARDGADDVNASSSPNPSVSASPTASGSPSGRNRGSDSLSGVNSENEAESTSDSPRVSESPRLNKAKRDVCAKKSRNVNRVMNRITDRATSQLDVFTKISERTQAFYVAKGKTVAGYDALVAATVTAKQKAVTDLAALKSTGAFTCDSADPKGSVEAFKVKVKVVVADLKAYKTSVKNLIVAVKSVQSTEGTN